jgi:poly(3-hydroxybutyrate) depolymerase
MPVALILAAALAQSAAGAAIDLTIPPGANFDQAEFRLWYPPSTEAVQATLVLGPGSNRDDRPMADEPFWQEFAARYGFAIVACRFTDTPHDQNFIENDVNVPWGTGQALLDALAGFADRARHTELAAAPLLFSFRDGRSRCASA